MRFFRIALATFMCFLSVSNPAWAVQVHGGTEGLVSHQIGHILFSAGMAYLLFSLEHKQIVGYGWFEFKAFLWLIIAWNFLTFSGHWMHEFVGHDKFIKAGGRTLSFNVTDLMDVYFYLTRLDHLLLVPAFVFLLLALKKWRSLP